MSRKLFCSLFILFIFSTSIATCIEQPEETIFDGSGFLDFEDCTLYLQDETFIDIENRIFNIYLFDSIPDQDIVKIIEQNIEEGFSVETYTEDDIQFFMLKQECGDKMVIIAPAFCGHTMIMLEKGIPVSHYTFPEHEQTEKEEPIPTPVPTQTRQSESKPAASLAEDRYCTECIGGECDECFGDGEFYCNGGCIGGRCIACDDGYTLIGYDINDNPRYRKCSYCNYGICKKCDGTGYVICRACSGSGRCRRCGGDGIR